MVLIDKIFHKLLQFKGFSPRGYEGPGRYLDFFDDDIFIVSYPKSGNTWVRFIVANMLNLNKKVDFGNIEDLIPDTYINSNTKLLNMENPRVLKSHEYFDPLMKNIIYITRDPMDVIVSLFYYLKKLKVLNSDYPIEEFVERMLQGEFDAKFGSWAENVGSWLGADNASKNILFLKYENLIDNENEEFRKIADFLDIELSESQLELVIHKSSFLNMRKSEDEDTTWEPNKGSDNKISFIRSGKVGEGRKELNQETEDKVSNLWGKQMRKLGYLP